MDTQPLQTAQDSNNVSPWREFVQEFWTKILGGIVLIAGLIGLFIPFIPGILLTLIGLYLLSLHSKWCRKHFHWARRQNVYVHRMFIYVEHNVLRHIVKKPKDYDTS